MHPKINKYYVERTRKQPGALFFLSGAVQSGQLAQELQADTRHPARDAVKDHLHADGHDYQAGDADEGAQDVVAAEEAADGAGEGHDAEVQGQGDADGNQGHGDAHFDREGDGGGDGGRTGDHGAGQGDDGQVDELAVVVVAEEHAGFEGLEAHGGEDQAAGDPQRVDFDVEYPVQDGFAEDDEGVQQDCRHDGRAQDQMEDFYFFGSAAGGGILQFFRFLGLLAHGQERYLAERVDDRQQIDRVYQ